MIKGSKNRDKLDRSTASTKRSGSGFSHKLATEDWSGELVTSNDLAFDVRPAHAGDEAQLAQFFLQISPVELYHRFLSGIDVEDRRRFESMTDDSDCRTIAFLGFNKNGRVIVAAILKSDEELGCAELAISARDDQRHRGLDQALLSHVVGYVEASGFKKLRLIDAWDDYGSAWLEGDMGFSRQHCPGDDDLMFAEKIFVPSQFEEVE